MFVLMLHPSLPDQKLLLSHYETHHEKVTLAFKAAK